MALSVEYLKVTDLVRYEKNTRLHSEEQIEQIVSSIEEFGFTNPVLINDKNVLIAGHGRLAAAEQMSMEEVPAIRLVGLTEQQQKALRIADSQLALNASWDLDLLSSEISDLDTGGFSLDLIGFDEEFLDSLLEDGGQAGDSEDGGSGEEGEQESNVKISVGPYSFSVDKDAWESWDKRVKEKVGRENRNIILELRRLLSL